jgi:sulfopyruvate decarboxylase beta subunit
MYKLPSLLVVTWRGFSGKDAPEHILMGEISPRLLDLLGIAHRTLAPDSVADDLGWAEREMKKRMEPVALLLPPKLLEPQKETGLGGRSSGAAGKTQDEKQRHDKVSAPSAPSLSRMEAMRHVLAEIGDELVIHANGYICRESFAITDRPENFYMIGSMGLASAIGLGLALTSNRTVVVFDGDGNLLMNLGILAMVGSSQPRKFIHIVFDNEVYGSTGNQRSLSREVRLDRLAAGAGYRRSAFVTEADQLRDATRQVLAEEGPTFLLVKVNQAEADVPRIPYAPEQIRDRFLKSVKGEK